MPFESVEFWTALGSSTAVVVVVFLFLRNTATRDEQARLRDQQITDESKQRDDEIMAFFDRQASRVDAALKHNTEAFVANTQSNGAVCEALRRINGH